MDNLPTINVAYSEILVLDRDGNYMYPGSNIPDYDIHPWHTFDFVNIDLVQEQLGITFPYRLDHNTPREVADALGRLGSQKFEDFLDNTDGSFRVGTVNEFLQTGENFIYPIMLYTSNLWHDYETAHIDPRVIRQAQLGKAKIVFAQFTEGFFGNRDSDYNWMVEFAKRNEIRKENVWMISSNLNCEETFRNRVAMQELSDSFTPYPYSYFQHNIWFISNGRLKNENTRNSIKELGLSCLKKNQERVVDKHFLCFNRIIKHHRLVLFAELMSNPAFLGKSITTLGPGDTSSCLFSDMVKASLTTPDPDAYRDGIERLVNFYKQYDQLSSTTYDQQDLTENQAANLNIEAHKQTFVNIVTESATDDKTVFFSEKIYKPIVCAQPFILAGNPYGLRTLRELGFKTFDKWWDESYDEECDFSRRMRKIVDVMETISTWTLDECNSILVEMEEVLLNNINVLLDTSPMYRITKDLGKF